MANSHWGLSDKNGRVIIVLKDLRQRRKTVGLKQTMKAEANRAGLFIGRGCGQRLVAAYWRHATKIFRFSAEHEALGKACGIDVGTAVRLVQLTNKVCP